MTVDQSIQRSSHAAHSHLQESRIGGRVEPYMSAGTGGTRLVTTWLPFTIVYVPNEGHGPNLLYKEV